MSILSERFAEFPEFLDYRQDQLMDVLRAVRTLKNINVDDPNEMIRTIGDLDLPRVHRMYQNKCNELRHGNNTLHNSLRRVSFRPFKAVLGADDYV